MRLMTASSEKKSPSARGGRHHPRLHTWPARGKKSEHNELKNGDVRISQKKGVGSQDYELLIWVKQRKFLQVLLEQTSYFDKKKKLVKKR